MSEMALTAEHLIVIGRGRLIADCTTKEFIEQNSELSVQVRTPELGRLLPLLAAAGARVSSQESDVAVVHGLETAHVGNLAFDNGVRLHELVPQRASLEEAFMGLTRESVEYHAGVPATESVETGDVPAEIGV
jgi:ABC-2 type transport system ATP-binding protein